MTARLRKGWCPGALQPMAAKDGLLVRLRITGGILSADKAATLADLAERFGSGLFDLSSRGNLQMRGVHDATLAALQDGLATIGLVDETAAGEAVRNVVASPLAGLHEGPDIRPLTTALERRLVNDATLHDLPAKFGFLIDDGSEPSLADIEADVRFDWAGNAFSIGLGNDANGAVRIGQCGADALVGEAARIAGIFLARSAALQSVTRMRDLGCDVLRDAFVHSNATAACAISSRVRKTDVVGRQTFGSNMTSLGLAVPFGRLDSAMLRQSAALAARSACNELRLTPWRTILLPGAPDPAIEPTGFITDPADPRLAVTACVGADGCSRGTTPTRAHAVRLVRDLEPHRGGGIALHVSGCPKGCAKATPSPITLVARDGRYDLVRDGRADDPPWRRGLDIDAVRAVLATADRA